MLAKLCLDVFELWGKGGTFLGSVSRSAGFRARFWRGHHRRFHDVFLPVLSGTLGSVKCKNERQL